MNKRYIIIILLALMIGIGIGKKWTSSSAQNIPENIHKGETAVEHWTCSMHPQIDQPAPGQCPICGMDLIPKNTETQDSLSPNAFVLSKKAMALAQVSTLKIGNEIPSKGNGNLKLTGRLTENSENIATQVVHIGGRIEKMYIQSEGDFVKKGQKIALVYSPELVTAQNELLQAMNIKEEQPVLYRSVRNKLKNWKLKENQIRQIEKTGKIITNMPVFADYTGYITKIKANEGIHLKEGGPLYQIADLSSLWVVADIYEKDLKNIKIGQKVKVNFNAYPDLSLMEKIDYIEPNLNGKTRTTQARILIQNRKHKFKPGMLAQISLLPTENSDKSFNNTIILPKTAILWTGKRSIVYIKKPGKQAVFEMRKVVLGKSLGDNIEVISGLKKGDEVVINGVFTIDASAQLQGKPSMMNTQGTKIKNNHAEMEM